jgi:hypothetical protein
VPNSPTFSNEAPATPPVEQLPPAPRQQDIDTPNNNLPPIPPQIKPVPDQSSTFPPSGQTGVLSVAHMRPTGPAFATSQDMAPVMTDTSPLQRTSGRMTSVTEMPQPLSAIPAAPRQPVVDDQFPPSGIGSALISAPLPSSPAIDKVQDATMAPAEMPWPDKDSSTALQGADASVFAPLRLSH